MARADDALRRRGLRARLPQHLKAINLGQSDAEQRHVEGLAAQGPQRQAPIGRPRHPVAARLEILAERIAKPRFVARQQHPDGRLGDHHSIVGRNTRNVLPLPTTLSTSMRPR